MPIYQYRCEHCSCEFELRKSFTEENAHAVCPGCGKEAERVFSVPGIVFKGSGFYVTDSRGKTSSPPGDGAKEKVKSDIKAVESGASKEIPS